MSFHELLCRAKAGDKQAKEVLFLMFRPLLLKQSYIDGKFCEDLFQELCLTFLQCINMFQVEMVMKRLKQDFFKQY